MFEVPAATPLATPAAEMDATEVLDEAQVAEVVTSVVVPSE
jgi:hypothetical protein